MDPCEELHRLEVCMLLPLALHQNPDANSFRYNAPSVRHGEAGSGEQGRWDFRTVEMGWDTARTQQVRAGVGSGGWGYPWSAPERR